MANTYTILLSAKINEAGFQKYITGLANKYTLILKGALSGAVAGATAGAAGGTTTGGATGTSQSTISLQQKVAAGQKNINDKIADWNRVATSANEIFVQRNQLTGQAIFATNTFTDKTGKQIKEVVTLNEKTGAFRDRIGKLEGGISNASEATRSWTNNISNNIEKVIQWAIATTAIYGALKQLQIGVQYIKDLNKELTNISIVTGMTQQETASLAQTYNRLARDMGVSTLAIAQGSLEWFRQGKTIEQTTELMKSSLMMATLGNMSAADSTEKLTATLNGFQLQSEDSVSIVDRLVALDNKYATSVNEIATAMQYSAAVSKQAGVSFNELASYITVISSVTRMSAETIGQSLKTMLTRMEQVKLGQMFEDDTTTISQVAESLHNVGIEIMATSDTFKPMGDVLDELGNKWNTLTQKQQNAIAGTIAGKFYARTYSNVWEYV